MSLKNPRLLLGIVPEIFLQNLSWLILFIYPWYLNPSSGSHVSPCLIQLCMCACGLTLHQGCCEICFIIHSEITF